VVLKSQKTTNQAESTRRPRRNGVLTWAMAIGGVLGFILLQFFGG
jgi:hypothetical protein